MNENPQSAAGIPEPSSGALRAPRADDFREHLGTADQEGRRLWIYPRKPRGPLYRRRTALSILLLLILFVGPFVKINGNPLLMFNLVERKFSFFGVMFWPQDMFLLALMTLIGFVMILLATAVYGRVWCGWLCPQTVLMELVFRKIEYWIEGDHLEQKALNAAPWTPRKIGLKLLKWGVFYGLSFIIGNLLLAYIIGSDNWIALVTDDPRLHLKGLTAMILFSLLFFGIFARFREQACTFICPYGRFQSVLLDENSVIVAYDHHRGEQRGRLHRGESFEKRRQEGRGDCIDCGLCVAVCPTGVDIRNGLQMECVHCTACIDACNGVMQRIGRPPGLVRYASQRSIEKGRPFRVTLRFVLYSLLLVGLIGLLGVLLSRRTPVSVDLLRAPGALYQRTPEGHYTNLYLASVLNRGARDRSIELRLENLPGKLTLAGSRTVKGGSLSKIAVIVDLAPKAIRAQKNPLRLALYADGKKMETVKTVFVAPSSFEGGAP